MFFFGGLRPAKPPTMSGSGLFLRGAGEVQKMEVALVVRCFFTFFSPYGLKIICTQKTGQTFWGNDAVSM